MENHELISFGDLPVSDLMHYGIKGMKWGVRRYQNKDGTLTPAGKKRQAKLEAELEKLGGNKSDSETKAKPKTVKEMTNEELREAVNRLQLERQLVSLYNELNPKKVSAGKEFTKKLGRSIGDAAAEAAKNAGRSFLEKKLKELMGIDDKKTKSVVETLKEEFQTLDYQDKISKIKNQQTTNNNNNANNIANLEREITNLRDRLDEMENK